MSRNPLGKSARGRRTFLKQTAQGLGAACVGGILWSHWLQKESRAAPYALRPPGALDTEDFLGQCIKCGQCVSACPYETLRLATPGDSLPIGTPYFEPRETPCYLCDDIPCQAACPTGALGTPLESVNDARMGLAVLTDHENCLSWRGLRCEICYRDCPLADEAIMLREKPRGRSKHAVFVPEVQSDACTGCGICEQACPLPQAAIRIFPRDQVKAELGAHYRFGWTDETPITREFQEAPPAAPPRRERDSQGGLDYLNNDEGL